VTDAIREAGERIAAAGESGRRQARDPVNLPIIENWIEAIGDDNPVYTDPEFAAASVHGGLVAPPAYPPLHFRRSPTEPDPLDLMQETRGSLDLRSSVMRALRAFTCLWATGAAGGPLEGGNAAWRSKG